MPKISVIVPVYNAKKYLGWCVNSILNQTFRDFELLLVNDGSTDGSLEICNNYAALDSRVRVITKENGGVSSARNQGLQEARGEYIQFVDSDDTIAPQMMERLLEAAKMYEKNLVICSSYQVAMMEDGTFGLNKLGLKGQVSEIVLDQEAFWRELAHLIWETSSIECPWNKLFSREIILENQLRFPEEYSLGEDFLFNLDYFEHCNGAVFISDPLYYYLVEQTQSLSGRYRPDFLQNVIDLEISLKQHIERHHKMKKQEQGYFYTHFVSRLCYGFIHVCQGPADQKEIKAEIAAAIQLPLVQAAFRKFTFIFPQYESFPEYVKAYDVGRICQICGSKGIKSEKQEIPTGKPGRLNRFLVNGIKTLQRLPSKGIKKWARIIELNLTTVGTKTTIKRIWKKIF